MTSRSTGRFRSSLRRTALVVESTSSTAAMSTATNTASIGERKPSWFPRFPREMTVYRRPPPYDRTAMASQTNTEAAPSGHAASAKSIRPAIVLAALGVVFGDIGTSPIYTVQTVFSPDDPHPVPLNTQNVYGVVSLIFWSIMIIVTLTYVTLVMRADNDGEGGIMALITLLRRWGLARGRRAALTLAMLGVFGAALFFGDSMITPSISVLSAIEGIEVVDPDFKRWVVPITVVIVVGLFIVQRHGTAAVGRLFGPIMLAWFIAIGACGVRGIVGHPEILKALSPTYAVTFIVGHFEIAFFALTAVVLAVTGAEA